MQSGIYWGYVGLISGLIDRIKAEYGKADDRDGDGRPCASLLKPDIPTIDHVDPDLTIRGLILIHARNAAKREKPAK